MRYRPLLLLLLAACTADSAPPKGQAAPPPAQLDPASPAAILPLASSQAAGTPGSISTKGCADGLWQHVYNPQRLLVFVGCDTVTGIIVDATHGKSRDGVRHEGDGDTHGWLKLDPEYAGMVNSGNINNEAGNLVFEIVCKYTVKQADAVASCDHPSRLKIPPIGSHVRMIGSYVQDQNHAHWNEIHPVSSITVLP